jgi:hypothetical protein
MNSCHSAENNALIHFFHNIQISNNFREIQLQTKEQSLYFILVITKGGFGGRGGAEEFTPIRTEVGAVLLTLSLPSKTGKKGISKKLR